MSYLDLPQVTFAGDFQADVSTINNEVVNFDVGTFDPATAELAWNPHGGGAFRLLNCRVRAARDRDGVVAHDDPILAAVVAGADDRVAAKMVDLDPQWQLSSALWGLRVEFRAGEDLVLAGDFAPVSLRDFWIPPVFGAQRPTLTARFQSVLQRLVWGRPGVSRIADQLRAATSGGRLSICLATFAFSFDRASPRFTLGAVVGAIGPYRPGEPHTFVAGRRFAPVVAANGVNTAGINFFDGVVRPGGRLVLGLANAMPVLDDSATLVDLGELRVGVLADPGTDQGATVTEGTGFTALGDPLPYREPGWLPDTSGIVTVPVPPGVDLTDRPLALLRANGTDHTVVIREAPDGWLVRADTHIHRAEAGETLSTRVHVTRFGRPVPRAEVTAQPLPPIEPGPGPGMPPPVGVPPAAFTPLPMAPTGPDGQTTLRVRCSDPGNPRGYLDGQVYRMVLGIRGVDQTALRQNPLEPIAALVFDDYQIPDDPTWFADVQPIFAQYANLYPVMSERLVRLNEYEDVRTHRAILQFAFSRDVDDPNSMPVTRDLSAAKRRMILDWLARPDLPLGVARPRPTQAPAAPRRADDAEPTDSKARFALGYLRDTGAVDGTEP